MKKIISVLLVLIATCAYAQDNDFVYDDHGKRDPFWRLVTPSGVIVNYDQDLLISDMILEGIIYDSMGKSFAIVNGSVIKPNDKIGLYVVTKIEQRKVTLKKGQEQFVLELKKEE